MKENIDVILCDKNNTIIKYYKNLGKRKVILPIKNAYKVYETPSNYFDDLEIGKKVEVIE